ncbi:tyrosine-type recombinase/integrase [Rubrolithibacter danxiaensis]|uniref:tyrosine-type recombinase/integrase n=1 Tax=Rubrolithibacter danxiaensis TaxID=3390805 RepID=UPI003BF77CA2
MIYTEPRIVATNDLKKRSYVIFYLNEERIREFNGRNIGLDIYPNRAKSLEERGQLLRKLEFELRKALEANLYPTTKKTFTLKKEKVIALTDKVILTSSQILEKALRKKIESNLSKSYKRNLKSVHKSFIKFLTEDELNESIRCISTSRIEEFLSQFNTSGTYYMTQRRHLGVLFSAAGKEIGEKLIIVHESETRRSKARLHKIYEKDQIKPILQFLKENHYNLYLCCLLTYGCFLRPHEEVRKLFGFHFKKDFTEIHLSGDENKGGKVRVVFIPDYVRKVLLERFKNISPNVNLFTLTTQVFNEYYFSTAWKRMWHKMLKKGLVQVNQTPYSFRHTAAVNVYKKTKDIHLLRELLGHSDMIVTMKYLRGLGEVNQEYLKDSLPEL